MDASEKRTADDEDMTTTTAMRRPPATAEVISETEPAATAGLSSPPHSSYRRYPSPRPPNLPEIGALAAAAAAAAAAQGGRKGSAGILRLDGAFSARRRGSAEPCSPSPSADRLSVSFAMDDGDGTTEAAAAAAAEEEGDAGKVTAFDLIW